MNNFDPTTIENALGDAIYAAGVSENVFSNRPKSSEKDLSDFVVCRVSGPVRDLGALGECTFSISLFAKNVANMKNGKKLSVMQERLKSIPLEFGNLVLKPYTFSPLGDMSDNHYGYHIRVINLQAFIKVS